MQFIDVRSMLKLPLLDVGIEGGCNFATTALLCNLISGISVVLYDLRDHRSKNGRRNDRENRFKRLLKEFYPWDLSENWRAKIEILYEVVRNPLVHTLGVRDKARRRQVIIEKSPLIESQIDEIERTDIRPNWVTQAISIMPTHLVINVLGLYWGVFHLVQRLSEDHSQMQEAENRIRQGEMVI
jgi:hypothetical protein